MTEALSQKTDRLEYRLKQMRAIQKQFGVVNTLFGIHGKLTSEAKAPILAVSDDSLSRVLRIRRTYSDMYGFIEVCKKGDYEVPKTLARTVGSKPIIDIGAYNGNSAAYFASRYPDSRVLAIEPNSDNYKLLRMNAALYFGQISTFKAAVSPTKGPIERVAFGFNSGDNMLSSFLPASEGSSAYDTDSLTPTEIVDLVDGQDIGILKVDIEGAEKGFFEAPDIGELLTRTGILLIETHNQFVTGSSETVNSAALSSGMVLSPLSDHTQMYLSGDLSS